jgi:hypothetical protein
MNFTQVTRQEALRNSANLAGLAPIPSSVIFQEGQRWDRKIEWGSQGIPSRSNSMARFFVKKLVEAQADTAMGAAVSLSGYRQIAALRLLGYASATVALSKLINGLTESDGQYVTGGEEYDTSSERKFLIDYDMSDMPNGAHSAIVHKNHLETAPFGNVELEEVPDGLHDGSEAWVYDSQEGLYVAIRTPAVPTTSLVANLAASTGGEQAAIELLDAENSVNLYPYLSLGHLAAGQ